MFSDVFILCLVHSMLLFVLTKGTAQAQQQRHPAVDFSKHRIVQPVIYHVKTKREISSTRNTSGAHHSEVTIKVPIDGQEYILDLRLNQDLVTDGHILRYQKNGKTVIHKPKKEDLDLCQYSGTVRNKPGSWVAVSTCHGVRGIVFDGKEMRYIEPVQGTVQSQHYIYDHSDLNNEYHCGYVGGVTHNASYDPQLFHKDHSEKEQQKSRISRYKRAAKRLTDVTQVRGPYDANKLSRYVELVLVADNGEYNVHGRNLRKVYRYMKDIVNIVNSIYSPLNIFIALVGVVVWTERDEIIFDKDGDKTLQNFVSYRTSELVKDIPNDNAQLLTRHPFPNGVIGKALVRAICSSKSIGVIADHRKVIGLVASTIAHEMGHNFGMEHDTDELCECPDQKCIMSPSSTAVTPTHWSSCSLNSLALSFEKGLDYCLRNKPKRIFDSPTCGNGFVESGEQCDCGTLADRFSYNQCHECCNPLTCMLRSNATCGAGTCCDLKRCRPKSAGTVCRSADRECDLPEFCTGVSEYCPDDVYKMDTTPCGEGGESAYCVRGSCRSHTDQCRLLWGTTGKNSHDKCYTRFNGKGEKTGNCGYDRLNQRYMPCAPRDAMCGTLQCRHFNKDLEFGTVFAMGNGHIYLPDEVISCHSATIDLGLSDVDPGLVPDGAKCGDEMMCLSQRCVSVAAVRERIASLDSSVCPSNCSGHGVCNSAGHCHCDVGFAPPLCALPGSGGSYESGPATNPIIQRNIMVAMYVIFLGIIPAILLVLFLIYYSRHNELLWWKKPSKSYVDFVCPSTKPNTKQLFAAEFNDSAASFRESLKVDSTSSNNCSEVSPAEIPMYKNIDITKIQTPTHKQIQPHYKPIKKIHKDDIQIVSNSDLKLPKPEVKFKPDLNKSEENKPNVMLGFEATIKEMTASNQQREQNFGNRGIPSNIKPIKKINKDDIQIARNSDLKLPKPEVKPKPDLNKSQENKPNVMLIRKGFEATIKEMTPNNGQRKQNFGNRGISSNKNNDNS